MRENYWLGERYRQKYSKAPKPKTPKCYPLFSMVGFAHSPCQKIYEWSLKYKHDLVDLHRCKRFQLTRDDDVVPHFDLILKFICPC